MFRVSRGRREGEREATNCHGCVVPLHTANTPALSAGTVVIVEFFSCHRYFHGNGEGDLQIATPRRRPRFQPVSVAT